MFLLGAGGLPMQSNTQGQPNALTMGYWCGKGEKVKSSGPFQFKEKVFLRQQGSYILTVEAGKQLLLSADSGAEAALQAELTEIQEKWKSASMYLEEQKKKLAFLLKVSWGWRPLQGVVLFPPIVSLRCTSCVIMEPAPPSDFLFYLRLCSVLHELEKFPNCQGNPLTK